MNLRVLGCHGGASARHRNVSFLIDERLALDAGSLASGLELDEQARIERVLVTHAHMDHVGELPTFVDARLQQDGPPLRVAGIASTLQALRTHLFNDVLWPDFGKFRSSHGPVLAYEELLPEQTETLDGLSVQAVLVDHSVPSAGFLIGDGRGRIAYSGDTGPTTRFWELVQQADDLRALITEVSFPDEQRELALASGHLTPALLDEQLQRAPRLIELPVLLYGIKPVAEPRVLEQIAALGRDNLRVLAAGDRISL